MDAVVQNIDSQVFRETLGHYPTGVVVVTALNADGQPEGLVIGSFTSVSLDPPLVAYLPMKASYTYGRVREAEYFCVNILAHDQLALCRALARGGPEKFEGVSWRPGPHGAPVLDGVVAWIECHRGQEVDAGDHYIALGEVRALTVERPVLPLLFFQGGYGRFTSSSMQLGNLTGQFGDFALSRNVVGVLDRLAAELSCDCHLVVRHGDDLVLAAIATHSRGSTGSFIGARVPLTPPMGTVFVAFEPPSEEDAWFARLGRIDDEAKERNRRALDQVRERGWSLVLQTEDPQGGPTALKEYSKPDRTPSDERRFRSLLAEMSPYHELFPLEDEAVYDVRWIEVPIREGGGAVEFSLRLENLPGAVTGSTIREWAAKAQAAARSAATLSTESSEVRGAP